MTSSPPAPAAVSPAPAAAPAAHEVRPDARRVDTLLPVQPTLLTVVLLKLYEP